MLNIALISLYGVENNGIRSISSVLKQGGLNTYLIFFKKWANNDIALPTEKEKQILVSLLKDLKVEQVGISFTSPFLRIAGDLTERIKDNLSAEIIWGGIHATAKPKECLEYCDIACRGEGEYAMLDLAKAHILKSPLEGIKNICYNKNGKVIVNEMRELIQDLDSLPYQDYAGNNKFFIDKELCEIDPLIYARELRVFASRGCPFDCSYCYNSILRGLYREEKYHRIRSVEGIISEIEYALKILRNVRKIKFDDDTFIFPDYWINEFSDKFKDRIGLPFEILFNAECLNKAMLRRLRGAGLRRIQAGIQTGAKKESEEVYHRNLSVEKIREFAYLAKELKLDVVYDVILDNPMQNTEDKEKLIDFLLSLPRPFSIFIYSLTVFPGTKICELFLEKGLIKPKDIEGEACKSFYQFRLSFSYPRNKEDLFFACIVSLTSKTFIPKSLIAFLKGRTVLRKHPMPLKWFAQACNQIKLLQIFLKMFVRGELSIWKIKEYGLPKRFLIQ